MTSTFDRLSAILMRDYALLPDQLTLAAPLQSLGLDSLGTVELLWNVEDEFRIKLPAEPVQLSTLGDVVRFVDDLVLCQAIALPNPTAAALPGAARAT